jgi:hypothetical protein
VCVCDCIQSYVYLTHVSTYTHKLRALHKLHTYHTYTDKHVYTHVHTHTHTHTLPPTTIAWTLQHTCVLCRLHSFFFTLSLSHTHTRFHPLLLPGLYNTPVYPIDCTPLSCTHFFCPFFPTGNFNHTSGERNKFEIK